MAKWLLPNAAALTACLVVSGLCQAQGYTLRTIDYPGASHTQILSVNNKDELVGHFGTEQVPSLTRSFVRDATGAFSELSATDAFITFARGINNHGQTVGDYGARPGGNVAFFNFLRTPNGSYKKWKVPPPFDGVPNDAFATVYGINDQGWQVGTFQIGPDAGSFVWRPSDDPKGTVTIIGPPSARAADINAAGQVSGHYIDDFTTRGFITRSAGGGEDYITVDFPDAGNTFLGGINNKGDVVGYWTPADNVQEAHPFVRTSDGSFTEFTVADVQELTFTDINDDGDIVGFFFDDGVYRGFMITPTSVPEPATSLLMAAGLAVAIAFLRFRH